MEEKKSSLNLAAELEIKYLERALGAIPSSDAEYARQDQDVKMAMMLHNYNLENDKIARDEIECSTRKAEAEAKARVEEAMRKKEFNFKKSQAEKEFMLKEKQIQNEQASRTLDTNLKQTQYETTRFDNLEKARQSDIQSKRDLWTKIAVAGIGGLVTFGTALLVQHLGRDNLEYLHGKAEEGTNNPYVGDAGKETNYVMDLMKRK